MKSLRLLSIARVALYVLVFFLPLLFFPWTTDMLEIHKQTLLVVATLIACLAWLGAMMKERTFSFGRSWMHLLPIAYLGAVVWSAIASNGGFLSWIGNTGQEYTSTLTIAMCVILFFLFSYFGREESFVRRALRLLFLSAFLSALFAIAVMAGWRPFPEASASFNTIGTTNALAIFLSVVSVLGLGRWLFGKRIKSSRLSAMDRAEDAVIVLLSFANFFLLLALDYWIFWIVFLSGLVTLFIYGLARAKDWAHIGRSLLPMIFLTLSVLFLFAKSPIHLFIPAEITPSLAVSWQVARQALQEQSSLFGSGPGTYAFDYAAYRPIDTYRTDLWNIRFDRSGSHLLTMLPTLGVLPIILAVIFLLAIFLSGTSTILRTKHDWPLQTIVLSAWVALLVAGAVYSSNMTLTFLLAMLSGLVASFAAPEKAAKPLAQTPRVHFIASCAFISAAIGILTMIFVTGGRYAAEITFAQAVALDQQQGDLNVIIKKLDQASTLNRFDDVYARNLAQALLLRVQQELANRQIDALPPETRRYLQELSSASINAAVRATHLAPRNVANWLIQGAIYREFAGVLPEASAFAINAYEQALTLEPGNPATFTELGKTHLVNVELSRSLLAAEDPGVKAQAEQNIQASLAAAETAFQKAIISKSDYAPAHYQLALAFEQQGRLNDAIGKMESIARYNPLDVGVAFQLGVLYLRRGEEADIPRAQAAFEQVVELMPSYSNARWFLAAIYEQQGNVAGALEQVTAVYALNPENEIVKARLDRLQAGQTALSGTEPIEESAIPAAIPEAQPR